MAMTLSERKAFDAVLAAARATVASLEALVVAEAPTAADDHLPLNECGAPVRTLRRAIADGSLPASLVGREYLVRRADLEAWLAAPRRAPRRPQQEHEPSAAERAIERARQTGTLCVVGGRR